VDEHEAAQQRRASARDQIVVLRFAHARHQDAVRAQGDADDAVARLVLRLHLPARVTHQQHIAVLLQQADDTLVVVHAAIDESHRLVRVDAAQHDRLEQAGNAGRSPHRSPESNAASLAILDLDSLRVRVVHPTQPVVPVDRGVDGPRRLAHPRRRELPVVTRVQRRRVQDQRRHLVLATPVVAFWREVRRAAFRLHEQVRHEAFAPPLAVLNARVEALLVELPQPVGARVARAEDHFQVGEQGCAETRTDVLLDTRQKIPRHALDDIDVVLARDLDVGLGLEQLLHLEVVVGPENRAPRDAGDDLDVAQDIELREPREDTDVVEGCAEASAREGETELAEVCRLQAERVVPEEGEQGPAGRGIAERFAAADIARGLESRQLRELLGRRLELPLRDTLDRCRPSQPFARLLVATEAEVGLGYGADEPPLPTDAVPGRLRTWHERLDDVLANGARQLAIRRGGLRGQPAFSVRRGLHAEQVGDVGGIDRRVACIRLEAFLVAAAVEAERPFEVVALAVDFPHPLVDRTGKPQRLLVLRRAEVFAPCEDLECEVEARRRRQVGILVRAEGVLLAQPVRQLGVVDPALARARQDLARVPKGVVVLELLHQNARIGGRDLAATEYFLRQLDSGLVLEIHCLSSTLMANENPVKTSRTTGLRQQRRKDVKSKEAMNRIRVFIMVRGGHSETSY
jgi:hypothetical protein